MAVFTAIATAIVGKVFAATLIGKVVVGLIATGLAVGTAKLLGVYEKPASAAGSQRDPGVKIQVPPATDNKIPRLYGRNYTGSVIFDAQISNQNKTMTYAMVISEYNAGETWTVNDIYRDDARLLFTGATVTGLEDTNATTANNVSGKMRVRVYAGGSSAANQIFPVGDAQNAYDFMPNWTTDHTMQDLVFAIFQMDYDAENDLTGLSAITFDISNSLNNPADVLLDYLRNSRYGAGLSNSFIDTTSFDSWRDYSSQLVDYVDNANVTQQHARYQIDGALSTFASVKENINKICLSGGAFFTYNNKLGKFGVVPTRAVSNAYIANAFVLNDDNIVSSINIGSTELFSLYNAIEIEYPSVKQRDQTDVYYAELDPAVLNPNEPYNKLDYRLDMVNDGSRVAQLANIDLNQSRFNTVLTFTADFSAMQVDVGDVVKINSELYGYVDRLFRVMRVTEKEDGEGVITVDLTLLEYSSDVYDDLIGVEDLPKPVTGISNWWLTNANAALTIGNVLIVNDPLGETANIHNPATGSVIGTIPMANVRTDYASLFSNTSTFINIPITVPANVNYNTARVVVENITASNTSIVLTQGTGNANVSYFEPQSTVNFGINTFEFDEDTQFRMVIDMFDTTTGVASLKYTTGTFQVSPSNIVPAPYIAPGAAGLHFVEVLPPYALDNANLTPSPTGSLANVNSVPIVTDVYEIFNPSGGTLPQYLGLYSISGVCFFTGEPTTSTSTGQYTLAVGITYEGNVIVDQGLTANVDYTTDISLWEKQGDRIPLYDSVVIDSTLFSSLLYQGSRTILDLPELDTFTITYGFDVKPKAGIINVYQYGASTLQNQNDLGFRGFKITYEVTEVNKGDLEPDQRTEYLNQET